MPDGGPSLGTAAMIVASASRKGCALLGFELGSARFLTGNRD